MERSQNFFAGIAHKIVLAALACIAALAFTFAPTNEAHAEGFEIGAGLGWIGQVNEGSHNHGFHIMLTPGYRFVDWVGIYLDESFGGLWWRYDGEHDDGHFFGHTVVNAKFFYPLGPGEIWGKVGIGGVYHSGEHWHTGGFAFKVGIGYTADIAGNFGIGGNFDYMLGAYDGFNGHYLDLQIHLRYKF